MRKVRLAATVLLIVVLYLNTGWLIAETINDVCAGNTESYTHMILHELNGNPLCSEKELTGKEYFLVYFLWWVILMSVLGMWLTYGIFCVAHYGLTAASYVWWIVLQGGFFQLFAETIALIPAWVRIPLFLLGVAFFSFYRSSQPCVVKDNQDNK